MSESKVILQIHIYESRKPFELHKTRQMERYYFCLIVDMRVNDNKFKIGDCRDFLIRSLSLTSGPYSQPLFTNPYVRSYSISISRTWIRQSHHLCFSESLHMPEFSCPLFLTYKPIPSMPGT